MQKKLECYPRTLSVSIRLLDHLELQPLHKHHDYFQHQFVLLVSVPQQEPIWICKLGALSLNFQAQSILHFLIHQQ